MTYELYRLQHFGDTTRGAVIATSDDFDTVVAVRDRDVVDQLAAAPTPPREFNHVIVGPGFRGARTEHALVTFAGADVADRDPAVEAAMTGAWLSCIRHWRALGAFLL
jgi:hypothetical protein